MHVKILTFVMACGIAAAIASSTHAQVATGTYPYGTFDSHEFEIVNVGNLNVHFAIPVISKTGREIPFTYALSFDSSVWYPSSVNGSNVWTPVQNFGWRGDTEIATGYIGYRQVSSTVLCSGARVPRITISSVAYHDPYGASHGFLGSVQMTYCPAGETITNTMHATALDGSGYQLANDVPDFNGPSPAGPIITRAGASFAVPVNASAGQATVTDSNGNQISVDSNGNFTDTTGHVALSVGGTSAELRPVRLSPIKT